MTYTPKPFITASDISVAALSDITAGLGTVTTGDYTGSMSLDADLGNQINVLNSAGAAVGSIAPISSPADGIRIGGGGAFLLMYTTTVNPTNTASMEGRFRASLVDADTFTISSVTVETGANDSAGTGYRALRIANE